MMTTDAKRALAKTIRTLRARLITDLGEATERAYRLSIDARKAQLDEAGRVKRARLEGMDRRAGPRAPRQGTHRRRPAPARRRDQGRRRHAAAAPGVPAPARGQRPPGRQGRHGRLGQPRLQGLPRGRPRAGPCRRDGRLRRAARPGVRRARARPARPVRPGADDAAGAGARGHAARGGRRPRRRRARLGVDRRHHARLDLPVLERPRARGARRQARRQQEAREPRDRVEDADVHRALHGGVAAPQHARPDLAGDVPAPRLDGPRTPARRQRGRWPVRPRPARHPPRRVAQRCASSAPTTAASRSTR